MIKELTILANHLDSKGLRKEADYLDAVIRKVAEPQTEGEAEASGDPKIEDYYKEREALSPHDKVLKKISKLIYEKAGKIEEFSNKDNPFTHHIHKGQLGNYYQFNIQGAAAKDIWNQAVANFGQDNLASESTKIVEKHLSISKSHHAWYDLVYTNLYMSWLLK